MTENDSLVLDGGCTCRSVRYRMTAPPMFVHCCHCTWCQRETGSAFVINALIEKDHVEVLSGEVDIIDTPSASGKGQKIHRCPKCRIAVWSNYSGAGDGILFLRVGTLDDPHRVPPDVHIFTSSKLPWVMLSADAPAFSDFYRFNDLWPQESINRYKAAQSKSAP
jgi:hypothetical protein